MFGGFTEGLQLFASFAMLMNFLRNNKMKGMGQIVSWSVRDESLHCEGMIKVYHAFNAETGAVTKSVASDIVECCKTVVGLEDKFIDLAFEAGEVQGMTPEDIKSYIRFIADWRLRQQLQPVPEVYGVKENPLPWPGSRCSARRRARQLLRGPEHRISPRPPRARAVGRAARACGRAFDQMQAKKSAAANEIPA